MFGTKWCNMTVVTMWSFHCVCEESSTWLNQTRAGVCVCFVQPIICILSIGEFCLVILFVTLTNSIFGAHESLSTNHHISQGLANSWKELLSKARPYGYVSMLCVFALNSYDDTSNSPSWGFSAAAGGRTAVVGFVTKVWERWQSFHGPSQYKLTVAGGFLWPDWVDF